MTRPTFAALLRAGLGRNFSGSSPVVLIGGGYKKAGLVVIKIGEQSDSAGYRALGQGD
jgi:hypothetical protein